MNRSSSARSHSRGPDTCSQSAKMGRRRGLRTLAKPRLQLYRCHNVRPPTTPPPGGIWCSNIDTTAWHTLPMKNGRTPHPSPGGPNDHRDDDRQPAPQRRDRPHRRRAQSPQPKDLERHRRRAAPATRIALNVLSAPDDGMGTASRRRRNPLDSRANATMAERLELADPARADEPDSSAGPQHPRRPRLLPGISRPR